MVMTTPVKNAVPDVEIPRRLMTRPFDKRGYLIPWFVDYVNGEPDFRTMDPAKWKIAVMQRRCWICGGVLGVNKVFVIGPMCAINLTSSEPPCHRECALYSVRACPFLSRPNMVRRIHDLPPDAEEVGGLGISRNPGVTMLWTTPDYTTFRDMNDKPLIRVGRWTRVEFYAEGRPASVPEIRHSVQTGLPLLWEAAHLQGPEAVRELEKVLKTAARVFPSGVL